MSDPVTEPITSDAPPAVVDAPPPAAAEPPAAPPATSSTDFDLTTFVSKFTTTLTRYELYPVDKPSCYVVGFATTYKDDSRRAFYRDTQVPLTDAADLTESEIINAGWLAIKDSVSTWAKGVLSSPRVQFTPTTL
jgi:hypothetical protein